MEYEEISSELKILKIIIDDEEIALFCRSAEMDFHCLAGPRNLSVDLNYDVLCACECLCTVYPLESG